MNTFTRLQKRWEFFWLMLAIAWKVFQLHEPEHLPLRVLVFVCFRKLGNAVGIDAHEVHLIGIPPIEINGVVDFISNREPSITEDHERIVVH